MEENLDRMLLLCLKVQDLHAQLFTLFSVNWVLLGSVRETKEEREDEGGEGRL